MEDWSDHRLLMETPTTPAAFGVFYRRHEDCGPRLLHAPHRATRSSRPTSPPRRSPRRCWARAASSPSAARRSAWLYGIARHRLMRSIEQGRVEDRARRKLDAAAAGDRRRPRRADRARSARRSARSSCSTQLPSDQAEAVRARVLDQRSYKDIAATVQGLRGGRAQARQPRPAGLARAGERTPVSAFPELEAALESGRAPALRAPAPQVLVRAPDRSEQDRRCAAAAAAVVVVLVPARRRLAGRAGTPGDVVVPAATLELSHTLTRVPSPAKKPIYADAGRRHAELPAVAAELRAFDPVPAGS